MTTVIHPFGFAPQVVPPGHKLVTEVEGTDEQLAQVFANADVILVRSAAVAGAAGVHQVGVFAPSDPDEGSGLETWYVEGGPVAAVVCTSLITGGATFTCEPTNGDDGEQWFAFSLRAVDSVRLRPVIAHDTPSYGAGH